MTYEEWCKANTVEYKGYEITEGSVSKNGECLLMAFSPLGATPEQEQKLLNSAKEWIDKEVV